MRVLVSDDLPDVREALRLLLKGAGHEAETVDSPAGLLEAVARRPFDLILMDLNYTRDTTSGREGLDLLAELEARRNAAPVVVMTAWGDIEIAVEAMRHGAADFVQKPWDNARLVENAGAAGARARRPGRGGAARTLRHAGGAQRAATPAAGGSAGYGGLDCAASFRPAGDVGGDYYDFLTLGPGRTAMLLADVSGKGISAAILMAHLRASFHSQPVEAFLDPVAALGAVHRIFWESTPVEQYATLVWVEYDEPGHRLRYVNCGHPAPILVRAGGAVERLQPTATVFGLLEQWNASAATVAVAPGDTLWLFSDGVSEATLANGDEWGEARLTQLLCAMRGAPLEAVMEAALAAAAPGDDRTLVACGFASAAVPTAKSPPGACDTLLEVASRTVYEVLAETARQFGDAPALHQPIPGNGERRYLTYS